jgi:hypothetical protein
MMTSISNNYYQIFLAQSVCSGIGCSFLFFPSECPSVVVSPFALARTGIRILLTLTL